LRPFFVVCANRSSPHGCGHQQQPFSNVVARHAQQTNAVE
jgi:hypothetical protein